MERVIVTGGTGFIGANLARKLLENFEVHLLVRPGYAGWRIADISSDVELHELELADEERVRKVLKQLKPARLFHLAAHGAYSWQTDWREMLSTNVQATMNLVEAGIANGAQAIVVAGSSSEYGVKDHAPKETEFADPNSYYATTKLAATQYCRFVGTSKKQPVCVLRLYSAYGPFEAPERFVPSLILRGLEGKLPPLVPPAIARDYIYVDDVCDAFLKAADAAARYPGAVWNVGSGVQTTIGEFVELARTMLGIIEEPRFGSMPARTWDTEVWKADSALIAEQLGWSPTHDLQSGFGEMIMWFRKNENMLKHYQRQQSLSVRDSV